MATRRPELHDKQPQANLVYAQLRDEDLAPIYGVEPAPAIDQEQPAYPNAGKSPAHRLKAQPQRPTDHPRPPGRRYPFQRQPLRVSGSLPWHTGPADIDPSLQFMAEVEALKRYIEGPGSTTQSSAHTPPPSRDVGVSPESEPVHQTWEGVHPAPEWETLGPEYIENLGAELPKRALGPSWSTRWLNARQLAPEGLTLSKHETLHWRLKISTRLVEAAALFHHQGYVHGALRPKVITLLPLDQVLIDGWKTPQGLDHSEATYWPGDKTLRGDPGPISFQWRDVDLLGSPRYMAPEQLYGGPLTPRADVYTLGLLIQEALTLHSARTEGQIDDILHAAVDGDLHPVVAQHPQEHIPKGIAEVIARATDADPELRYDDAMEMAKALRDAIGEVQTEGRRHTQLLAWAGAILALTATSLVLPGAMPADPPTTLAAAPVRPTGVSPGQPAEETIPVTAQADAQARLQGIAQTLEHGLETWGHHAARLATGVESITIHASARAMKRYPAEGFANPSDGGQDLAMSPWYQAPISLDWPRLFTHTPGEAGRASRQKQRIPWILPLLKTPFRASQPTDVPYAQHVAAGAGPVHRVAISYASGLNALYPGQALLDPRWDGRDQPWYQAAETTHGSVRSGPEVAGLSGRKMWTVAHPFYRLDGTLNGVVGLMLNSDHLLEQTEASEVPLWWVDGSGSQPLNDLGWGTLPEAASENLRVAFARETFQGGQATYDGVTVRWTPVGEPAGFLATVLK